MELVDFVQGLAIFAGLNAAFFIVSYWLLARWWKSQEGQNVMLLAWIVFFAAVVSVIGRAGLVDLARILSAVVWMGVSVVLIWRTLLLYSAQHASLRSLLWRGTLRANQKPEKDSEPEGTL